MTSLSERLAKLANPEPIDVLAEEGPQVLEKQIYFEGDEFPSSSQLRKKTSVFEDEAGRYKGKKTSRKKMWKEEEPMETQSTSEESEEEAQKDLVDEELKEGGSEESEEEASEDSKEDASEDPNDDSQEESEDPNEDSDEEESKCVKEDELNQREGDGDEEFEEESSEDESSPRKAESSMLSSAMEEADSKEESDDEEEESDDDDDDDRESHDEEEGSDEEDMDDNIKTIQRLDLDEETDKGRAVRAQIAIWDKLVESRIQLQKGSCDCMNVEAEESAKARKALMSLLRTALELEMLLMEKSENNNNVQDDGDEEIPSDTEDDHVESKSEPETKETTKSRKRKLRLQQIPGVLEERHHKMAKYRNETILKWGEKTNLGQGKPQSLAHIQQKVTAVVQGLQEEEKILDDSDFYHGLLREVIERKSVGVTDPYALGRQWVEIQKLRRKMKKKVDTRASKGRKIRFDVKPKLVNFMAPWDTSSISDEAKDELYSSLFRSSGL